MDGFTVVAEPSRRAIVDALRDDPSDVTALVERLGISQSLTSKHLRVLREAGVVDVEVAGRRRVYRLTAEPLPDVLAWARPYYEMWARSLDALARALDDDAPASRAPRRKGRR